MYTLVERPDGYFELQEDGKVKSCPYQSIFFYPNPVDSRQIITHKQPCCNDCAMMDIDKEKGKFALKCNACWQFEDAEIIKRSTLTVIK